MTTLYDPIRLGDIEAPNRILMAPLTRGRSTRDHVPQPVMGEYYAQRASAGIIISEATGISQEGLGWPNAPGIWSDAQVAAWTPIVQAVHDAGGRFFIQLWHMGRLVHPSFTSGRPPVSASATTGPGKAHTDSGKQAYVEARPLAEAEFPRLLDDYARATANALRAGFDGVQIHAANGYLIDQFLRDNSNFRTDRYGGSIENRVRLLVDVVDRVAAEAGAGRTAVRLSPNGDSQGANDSAPHALFPAAAKAIAGRGLAFLELREPGFDGTFGAAETTPVAPGIRAAFDGPLVLNSDYDRAKAEAAIVAGEADAVAFGRPFLANPDLPRRFAEGLPLNADNPATWYASPGGDLGIGYTDYPEWGARAA